MSRRRSRFWVLALVIFAGAIPAVFFLQRREATGRPDQVDRPVPVAVASIERGPIELRRTFTGALEAYSSFTVASKVGGRIRSVFADISDSVDRGQILAKLDDAELESEEAQALANLAVANANLAEAQSQVEIATRDTERLIALRGKGFTSDSQFEVADAERLAREARLKVAEAQITRAKAALNSTRIRRSYSDVVAEWDGDDTQRVVAERFVDEGVTVSANTPLLRIVEIDRMTAVITVTERDYALLKVGQEATIVTDAFQGETFRGTIERIAPIFREATRQARVELFVPNLDRKLKPGMFVRASLILDREDEAIIVPESALTRRDETDGCFVVPAGGDRVRWVEVTIGIRDGECVQVFGDGLTGNVVVLGQQLLDDGSAVIVPELPGPDLAP